MAIKLKFNLPISTLATESDLILTAAESPAYSAALTDRLEPPTLVADGRALWRTLFETPDEPPTPPAEQPADGSSAAQARASAEVGDLTAEQQRLLDAYTTLAANARKSAKIAFKGQKVKLHDEFRVGAYSRRGIRDILAEARLLLAAVRNPANAGPLKAKGGYIKKDADALAGAIADLEDSETEQETAKGGALGATDARNGKLNQLYDTAIAIQNAARNEFTTREAQTAFRIGIFPPKQRPKSDGGTPAPAPTP